VVLFLGEMLTASAMGFFQHELERALVLALFIPLIISAGGNAGSQASTLIIRAMALGEITMRGLVARDAARDRFRCAARNATRHHRFSTHCSLVGFFARVRRTLHAGWIYRGDDGDGHRALGDDSGAMLPIVLRRLGLDPATSSAPFVATLVDVTGLIIYFTAAMLILRAPCFETIRVANAVAPRTVPAQTPGSAHESRHPLFASWRIVLRCATIPRRSARP
jgi:magnesium transporter